ncbi:helix-turn-helix domain-containing protein [Zavarzinia compransoris]|uniref:helix-turn-helix domain-containing protein n=1 Tax=Zavarzinia marina TaxID=2911065 RepID=UPI001F38FA3B|nr:helix-turn-helix domain-containing protein [Zavarzinia marina]MCF4166359.1 helix-turn-helix domain-containing protein [Zavarzinia marina]
MEMDPARNLLLGLMAKAGATYAELSRLVGKNDTYIQQYITKGSPVELGEQQRELLGEHFGVDPDLFRRSDHPKRIAAAASSEDEPAPAPHMNRVATEIERRMTRLGSNPKRLAKEAGLGETAVRDILKGISDSPRVSTLTKLAKALGCTVADLTGESAIEPRRLSASRVEERERDDLEPNISIDELDVAAGNASGGQIHERNDTDYGERVVARWEVPTNVLRAYTSAPAASLKVITCVGDSNEPALMPGQRVLVDLDQRLPSPPGFFAIWDGVGEIIKRLEVIHGSDPVRVIVRSANPAYEPYERLLADLVINGRVIGKWQWT